MASLVLVVLLAQALAGLTWSLLPTPEQTAEPPRPSASTAPVSRVDYQRIAALHLFGVPRVEQAAKPAPTDAPETRLNLTLRGILFNPDPLFARAIISSPGKEDELYKAGDPVPGGATIDQIYSDRVMLLRGGQYEALRLPEDRLDVPTTAYGGPDAGGGESLPSGGAGVLTEYRRQIIENPEQAMQFIQAQPVNRGGGGIVGFQVQPGADPGMFQLAGLEAGDIVTAVNEVELNSLDKGFEAIEELAASDQITIRVLRNGQEQTLQLQLQ